MYATGTGSNACDLMDAINTMLVTTLTTNAWTLKYSKNATYNSASRLAEAIWSGKGDGNDNIYIQMRISNVGGAITDATKIYLDGLAGYDANLAYYEQPGGIQSSLYALGTQEVLQPAFTIADSSQFTYWIFANTQRLIVIIKLSTYYESMYLGFINPISAERQFPYPMYVAGNGSALGNSWPNNINGSFIFPSDGSGYLRRADGTWRSFDARGSDTLFPVGTTIGTVFPYNTGNKNLVQLYTSDTNVSEVDALMFPVILCTTSPNDMCGILDGVFYVSGTTDISAEQTLTYNGEQYMIFDTKAYRGLNTYFAIKLA